MIIEARLGEPGGSELDLWLHKVGVEIVAIEAEHVDQARRAWRRYGKGRHPAGLNYGDCFSYALAALTVTGVLPTSSIGTEILHAEIHGEIEAGIEVV